MKYFDFELDENKDYYIVMGGRANGKIFNYLNIIAKTIRKKYGFERYCINDFPYFYSIELFHYKGTSFSCSATIMKDQYSKMNYEDLTYYIVNGIDQEVKAYENRKQD